jgi:hypothetical protein
MISQIEETPLETAYQVNKTTYQANGELKLEGPFEPMGVFMEMSSCENKTLVSRFGVNGSFLTEQRFSKTPSGELKIEQFQLKTSPKEHLPNDSRAGAIEQMIDAWKKLKGSPRVKKSSQVCPRN